MKSKELQLGDWVTCRNRNTFLKEISETEFSNEIIETVENIQIGILTTHLIGFLKWDSFLQKMREETYFSENFIPIPLSEEILRFNGFSEDGKFSNDEVKIDYAFYDGFNFNIKTKLMELQVVFWNVHELQNALRLCGLIELANNFKIQEKENGED